MYAFVANLTVVAMLTHAALGCCWHHDHAHFERSSRQTTYLPHADCHHGGHFCSHETGRQDSHPTSECDGSRCMFIGATRTVAAQQVSDSQDMPSVALAASDHLPATPLWRTSTAFLNRPVLPDRVCVLHQVFLL